MTSYTFSIDFPRWKVLSYDSFRSKVVLLAKRNMLRDLRDQSERFKWSREQAQNLSLHIFSHNYHNYSMFRDVPECFGMFHAPGFIDDRNSSSWTMLMLFVSFFLNKNKPCRSIYHAKLVNVWNFKRILWKPMEYRPDPKLANFYHDLYASS